jgi:hypothetical protein
MPDMSSHMVTSRIRAACCSRTTRERLAVPMDPVSVSARLRAVLQVRGRQGLGYVGPD